MENLKVVNDETNQPHLISSNTTETFLIQTQLDKRKTQMNEYSKAMKRINKEIYNLEKKLYNTCNHTFIRDTEVAFDEIFKYKCTNCNLYKNYF